MTMDTGKVTDPRDSNQLTRAYLNSLLVETRYLDSCVPSLEMELFGRRFSSPIMRAAFSHLGGTHPGGMAEMARGARLAGICNWAGMGDPAELEDILATGAPTIKIVKPYADRGLVFERLRHAERAGALAVGVDIDHSFDRRGMPDHVLGMDMKPVSLQELRAFVRATGLPFIVKGVLSVQDAVKCAEAGVQGIVVSHHHGIMPGAVPPLMALPRIRDAVGGTLQLFVDCSIDSGEDAFKCLALGARAVCVGRACLPAFRDGGAEGVRQYVDGMNDQLRAMMARTGSQSPDSIPRDVLWSAADGQIVR